VTGDAHLNELILEFLAEIHEDFTTLRQMSDDEIARLFREWLQQRHLERYPTLQLPLRDAAE
jgi:hypothetical protein